MRLALYLSAVLLAGSTTSSDSPTETSIGRDGAWFCDAVRGWKAVMHRDYPDADRSVPEAERLCRLPREPHP